MPTVSLPPQILESPPATLEGIVDLNAFANWFLPDDQVRAFLEALGNNKEWEIREAFRKSGEAKDGQLVHEPIGFELSGVPTKEISILRYREGPGWLEIYPIAGKPLSGIVFHSEDLPLGVAGSVNHIYDQWLRINAHLYPQDPMFKVIQQAVGHLGERSTVTVSGTYSERRTERFVFPGPYFASDGSLLHEKLEHARKNPLQG